MTTLNLSQVGMELGEVYVCFGANETHPRLGDGSDLTQIRSTSIPLTPLTSSPLTLILTQLFYPHASNGYGHGLGFATCQAKPIQA